MCRRISNFSHQQASSLCSGFGEVKVNILIRQLAA